MTLLPRSLQALQERILDRIKAAHPGTTDTEIGNAAAYDRSAVSKSRNGEREFADTSRWVGLIRAFGAPAVLGELAAIDGCRVVREDAPAESGRGLTIALDLSRGVAELAQMVDAAERDGIWDADETESVHTLLRSIDSQVIRLRSRARPGRVG